VGRSLPEFNAPLPVTTMMNLTSRHAAITALPLLLALATALPAQVAPTDSTVGRRRIQPFPALGSAPETGLQFGLTVLSVFEPPAMRHARPASLVATALRSTKGQTRLSVEGERWSANNDRRLQGLLAWQKFPLPYFGLGASAPERAKELYTPTGVEATASVQQRVRGAWYALATARFISQDITPDSSTGELALNTRLVGRTGGRVSELGVGVLRDSRDFVFNPTRGTFAQLTYAVSASAIGSEFGYERLRLDARKYAALGGEHVLAMHAQLIGTTGEAPFDQLALVGGGDIMRGYTRGRYREAWFTAAQIEYRSPIRRRLGAVAFAGAGTVAPNAGGLLDMAEGTLLPTYGAGARIQIDARQRTAVRVDYGRGTKGASGLYIGFNQAF
jgi:Omp85 superfamily domain